MTTTETLLDSLKVLGGASALWLGRWIYQQAIPALRRSRKPAPAAIPAPTPPPAPPPAPASQNGGTAQQGALILERLRSQEAEAVIEKARAANIEVYLREIRVLSAKLDAIATGRAVGFSDLAKLAARMRRVAEDLEGVKDAIADLLKKG